ncbi:MAG: hypothetical protein J1F11_06465 [Oscillospiraceae bacterium]|nr:hypothetical protein [Oscillospiraceae bacterium]
MKKETKEFIIGNSHIFDSTELDERQKSEMYKITFQLFIGLFYTMLYLSIIVFAYAIFTANTPLMAAGIATMALTEFFIVLYAAKTSSKGIMNPDFAKKTAQPSYAVICTASAVLVYFSMITKVTVVSRTLALLYILEYVIENFLLFYFARRNFKVLENQLKDDED